MEHSVKLMSDFENRKDEIRKKVHQTSIYISTNLREEDKTRFMQFADSQFKGDYGLSLRWLLDLSEGFFTKPDDVLSARIDVLAGEIQKIDNVLAELTAKPEEPERKKIKTLSGKQI